MVAGTATTDTVSVFSRIPQETREKVKEVTLDFSNSMEHAARAAFPCARMTTDRFHVAQIVTEALQQVRIALRWKAIKEETAAMKIAQRKRKRYRPVVYANGDTKKQLLARSRYLLFKPSSQWTRSQQERADILFTVFPVLANGYALAMQFRNIYEQSRTRKEGREKFYAWCQAVHTKSSDTFRTVAEYLKQHLETILNYFPHRNTNASAESFNAKLKGFRALVRGVRDVKFFLYRVAMIYG